MRAAKSEENIARNQNRSAGRIGRERESRSHPGEGDSACDDVGNGVLNVPTSVATSRSGAYVKGQDGRYTQTCAATQTSRMPQDPLAKQGPEYDPQSVERIQRLKQALDAGDFDKTFEETFPEAVPTGETVCKGLIAAIYENAFEIADQIVQNLRDQQIEPSMGDPACRGAFALDWFVARLAYLHVSSSGIRDSGLKELFRNEVEATIEEVSKTVHDAKPDFDQYCMLAIGYLDGLRDSLGHRPGPGPFLSTRYSKHVRAIRGGRYTNREDLNEMDSELIAISLLGDKICWTLNGTLDEVLSSALGM